MLDRHASHDDLDRLIEEWTSERDHYEVMRVLQAAGVKAAPVVDGKEVLFDPHFRERNHFDIVDQPVLGPRPVQRHVAAKFTRFEPKAHRHAPLLGEHNEEVLREIGVSDDEISQLKEAKVIADQPAYPVPGRIVSMALKLPYDRYLENGILLAVEEDYGRQLGIDSGTPPK
jgi:crotonobetainyl-CoA:carnitine CoA-transferase CaiB-like acyl-CoA transferase